MFSSTGSRKSIFNFDLAHSYCIFFSAYVIRIVCSKELSLWAGYRVLSHWRILGKGRMARVFLTISLTQAEHQTTMIFVSTKIWRWKHTSSCPSNMANFVVFCVFCIFMKVCWPSNLMLKRWKHSSTAQDQSIQSCHYFVPRHMVSSFLVSEKTWCPRSINKCVLKRRWLGCTGAKYR